MREQIIELDGKKYRIVPVEDTPEPTEPQKPRRTGYERAENGEPYWYTDALKSAMCAHGDCLTNQSCSITWIKIEPKRGRREKDIM